MPEEPQRQHRKTPLGGPSFRVSQRWGLSLALFLLSILGEQMRTDDTDKFAGVDDFGFLPELWEMPLIAGDQVVRAGGVCAFEENVIGGVGRDLKRAGGRDEIRSVFEELKKLLPESFANMEFRAR